MSNLNTSQPNSTAVHAPMDMGRAAWTVTAVFILSNSATPLYLVWQGKLGFSSGTLTVIFALYIAGLLNTLLVAGQLSDRYGRKRIVIPGIVSGLIACVLFGSATSIVPLVVARLLSGIAVGAIVSAGMAAVVDLGGVERSRQASLISSVAMVLGVGLGPLLAGSFAQMLARPIVPVFGVEFFILLSALLIAVCLPLSKPAKQAGGLRLRLPSVPAINLWHVARGIGVFAPGISGTSFVLALGPSLLSHLLQVRSPLLAGGMACAMFLTATGIQIAARTRAIPVLYRPKPALKLFKSCTMHAASAKSTGDAYPGPLLAQSVKTRAEVIAELKAYRLTHSAVADDGAIKF